MAQIQSEPPTEAPQRLYDLDNFRTYLTGLVIYHHTAIAYGGSGQWIYRSQFQTPDSSPPLIAFNSVNQSYFMASFFFLSGYFSSRALKRKGASGFLSTKFFKLGLPTLAFTLCGGPAQKALIKRCNGEKVGWKVLLDSWKSLRGIRGPVWYLALVLIFDSIYALIPSITTHTSQFHFLPTFVLNIATTFLVRLFYPIGIIFAPLNLQVGFSPQYLFAYTLGASSSSPPTPPLTPTSRNLLLAASLLSSFTAAALLYFYPESYTLSSFTGGLNLLALSYAVWGESTGYLLGSAILALFRRKFNLSRRWANVGRYSYSAFLVHPIVVVGVQVACDGWKAGGVLKTAVVGTIGVLGSWGVGWLLVRVPGVGRVLV